MLLGDLGKLVEDASDSLKFLLTYRKAIEIYYFSSSIMTCSFGAKKLLTFKNLSQTRKFLLSIDEGKKMYIMAYV